MYGSKRTSNVFYSFRGAAPGRGLADAGGTSLLLESDAAHTRQLEDNVTKALVNVLFHAEPLVWRRFLEEVVGLPASASGQPQFAMQRGLTAGDVRGRGQRVLLGLVPPGQDGPAKDGTRRALTDARRPDATIRGEDFAVLVEAKVEGGLDDSQWRGHAEALRGDEPDAPITERVRTWGHVHQCFSTLRRDLAAGGLSAWLVDQFLEYLRLEHLAGFAGFDAEMFDYFEDRDDENQRAMVRRTVAALAGELQRRVTGINEWYAEHDVGNLNAIDTSCWVAFGPQTRGAATGVYRRSAHMTVALRHHGVEVFANAELLPATNRLGWLIREKRDELLETLRPAASLHTEIRVEERVQRKTAAGKPLPRKYDYAPRLTCQVRDLFDPVSGPANATKVFDTILELALPAVSIVRIVPRADFTQSPAPDPGASLDAICSAIAQLDPVVRAINDARPRAGRHQSGDAARVGTR